jgi:hypothetical protein
MDAWIVVGLLLYVIVRKTTNRAVAELPIQHEVAWVAA